MIRPPSMNYGNYTTYDYGLSENQNKKQANVPTHTDQLTWISKYVNCRFYIMEKLVIKHRIDEEPTLIFIMNKLLGFRLGYLQDRVFVLNL